jgi:diguanylate cyclase (GGDEF)-like protein
MLNLPFDLPYPEPDSEISEKLLDAQRVTLGVTALLVLSSLAGWGLHSIDPGIFPRWAPMNLQAILLTTFSGLSLALSHPRYSRLCHLGSILLACCVALLSSAVILEYVLHISLGIDTTLAAGQPVSVAFRNRMAYQAAFGFVCFGVAELFATVSKRSLFVAADLLTFWQGAVVLTVVTGHFIAISSFFDSQTPVPTSAQTMICLLLLSAVLVMRRTEWGVLSVFLGRGPGSKLARLIAPLILLLPYLREALRAHFISDTRMPAYYTTAMIGTLAVAVSTGVMIYLARRINTMEIEIRDLSLRDALTDLYNLRGFRLLAEQGLRVARRLDEPFSVLYIDIDNLKSTNDTLGHQAGSDLLVELAEILKSSFRETDIVGRIGGDEFAVAGQFSEAHIAQAAHQLQVSAEVANRRHSQAPVLSFSVGCVTLKPSDQETLDDLLARADQAMYSEKRRRKLTAV